MISIKKINQDYAGADQPNATDFQKLVEQGYQSVINLRSVGENGFLENEADLVAEVGLEYRHLSLNSEIAEDRGIEAILAEVQKLPKPIVFHCGAGARGSALALIALGIQEGLSHDEIVQKAEELGISLEQPHLKLFLSHNFLTTSA
ncbi:sulfur transferase domain-containing protein [Thermosynechococcaceae cyanobacterium BACA0444]|uniref:Sulfur transferase domain-containing protein n=1 Tax=Pseudocalidococcus azoricus BACA0444 TaxID=2918990 RepID=A0AAE4FVP1_9CYAN|nr:sulfur transferase domain-containing protein [Pseudocalidococcus azoricus]MDS3862142.1 sulfur transferase domain-containing protein [Pseudocalidococcus azoricus BACA0444]